MKRSTVFSFSLIVLASFSLPGFKCINTKPNAAKDAAENPAAMNYSMYCAGCHGDNLEKFTAKKWMDEPGNASVINSIKLGIESEGMPSFKETFTENELEELAAYVKKGIPEDKSLLKPAVFPGGVMQTEVQNFIFDKPIPKNETGDVLANRFTLQSETRRSRQNFVDISGGLDSRRQNESRQKIYRREKFAEKPSSHIPLLTLTTINFPGESSGEMEEDARIFFLK